jgi:hypothetical protein
MTTPLQEKLEEIRQRRARAAEAMPATVRFTAAAREELDEIEFVDHEERGGWLFGEFDGLEIVVRAIRGADWDSGHRGDESSMLVAGKYAAQWEDRLGLEACGVIHSHPATAPHERLRLSTGPAPSGENAPLSAVKSWGHSMAMIAVGLDVEHAIFGDEITGWSNPRMRAWIAHRQDGTIRPAEVTFDRKRS